MSTTDTPNSAEKNESSPNDPTLLCRTLKDLCTSNIEYFKDKDSVSGQRLYGAFTGIIDHTEHIETLMAEVQQFVHHYDFDPATPGNGYRSFLFVGQTAIQHSIKTARYVTDNRGSVLFRQSHFMKEIEACHHLLASLCTCIKHLITLHEWTRDSYSLFPHESHTVEDLLARAETINQYSFYGRCLGFQFCESMKPLLKFVSISMAGFSESYYSENGSFTKATSSMYASGKYFLDPELRARRIVNISQSASVDFCKV
jgi:hormone-sensitive lipase